MKDKKDKPSGKEIIKDINSVKKVSDMDIDKSRLDLPDTEHPRSGGRQGGSSVQDGGRDVGTSAGSH